MATLFEIITNIENQNEIVSLRNKYGVFWTGKAKYVFGAVTAEAWNGTNIEVVRGTK